MPTMIVLVDLKEGVAPEAYERWVLESYAPAVRELPSVSDWRNHRVTGLLVSDAEPPYRYVVTLELDRDPPQEGSGRLDRHVWRALREAAVGEGSSPTRRKGVSLYDLVRGLGWTREALLHQVREDAKDWALGEWAPLPAGGVVFRLNTRQADGVRDSAAAVRSATRSSKVSFNRVSCSNPSAFSRAAPAMVAMKSASLSSSGPNMP